MSNKLNHPRRADLWAALRTIGAACRGRGDPESWVQQVVDSWLPEVENLSREALIDAGRQWARTETHRPSLTEFLAVLQVTRTDSDKSKQASGCLECQFTGWRWLYVHYLPEVGRQRCESFTAACTCERGKRYAKSSGGHGVNEACAQAKRRSGFIELHTTDRHQPVIPLVNRVSPYQFQIITDRPRRSSFKM